MVIYHPFPYEYPKSLYYPLDMLHPKYSYYPSFLHPKNSYYQKQLLSKIHILSINHLPFPSIVFYIVASLFYIETKG